jgi:hypothetical protein
VHWQTCKDLLELSKLRGVWLTLLYTEVLHRSIPIPRLSGRNPTTLTSPELETCLVDALRLRRNWSLPSPISLRKSTFTTVHDPQSQVVSLTFLPARDHCWLVSLTLTSGTGQRSYTLQCWDVSNTPATCVARRVLPVFRGFRINTDPTHVGILALRTSL